MSDKDVGAASALLLVISVFGFFVAVVSAWHHGPAGVAYGFIMAAGAASFAVKMWASRP